MIIIIWSVPVFDYVYILSGGGLAYSSEVVANYLYTHAFVRFNVGYASAVGTLMFIYVIFIVGIFDIIFGFNNALLNAVIFQLNNSLFNFIFFKLSLKIET